MTNQDDMIKLIRSISGQANVLTIPRVYIGFTKSHRAALFLSQCVYWSDRSRLPDGWFYKSFREWHEELGLNQHAVETCVKTLKAGEWLHTKIETVQKSPTTFYRADLDKIATSIRLYLSDHHIEEPYIAETAKYGDEHLEEPAKSIKQKTISPSIKQKLSSEITGIVHPDFIAACARLKAAYPTDYAKAAPVLIEADDHPYRLHVRLAAMPPDFIERLSAALREVNPRRSYKITYQTNGTGHAAEHGTPEPAISAPDPYAPTEAQLQTWRNIIDELSFDVQPNTRKAYIDPARVVSVNGNWTIEVPSPEWWTNNMTRSLKRVYRKLTGESTEFVFVEPLR